LKKEINDLTRKSKLNYLGRTGLTNFACTNYISCIHPDTDHGYEDVVKNLGKKDGKGALRPCATYIKTGCGRHDYNFAYVRWGIVIRTMANTVWYVFSLGSYYKLTNVQGVQWTS
jgi:hypothetical protein